MIRTALVCGLLALGAGVAPVAGLGCAATAVVPPAPRQEPPEAPPESPAPEGPLGPAAADPEAEAARAWREAGAVGEHHAHLTAFVGEWTVTSRFWATPDAEPVTSTGSASNRLILGGRFVQLDYSGDLPAAGGADAFTGHGLLGYDNLEQWHVAVWVDSLTTAVLAQQGVCDADGRQLTLTGTFTDAVTGEKRTARSVYRVESDTRYVHEMHLPDADGREYRALEVVHVRRG
jgi:hypothetical protein